MRFSARLGLLLDTTYILPVLGVEVEGVERVLEALQRLRRRREVEIYYSCYSILEALWKLAKLGYDLEVVRRGLSLVEEDFRQAHPTLEGYLKALELRRRGFPDLIDLLLYTTALSNGILFLTRDKHLHEFLSEEGEETGAILLEEDFLREHA